MLSKARMDSNFDALVDPRLLGNYDPDEMTKMVACAAACVRYTACNRPPMSQVILFPVCFFFEQVVRRVANPTNLENIESSNITRKLRKAFSLFNNEKKRSVCVCVCIQATYIFFSTPYSHGLLDCPSPPSWNGILFSFIDP